MNHSNLPLLPLTCLISIIVNSRIIWQAVTDWSNAEWTQIIWAVSNMCLEKLNLQTEMKLHHWKGNFSARGSEESPSMTTRNATVDTEVKWRPEKAKLIRTKVIFMEFHPKTLMWDGIRAWKTLCGTESPFCCHVKSYAPSVQQWSSTTYPSSANDFFLGSPFTGEISFLYTV